MRTGNAITIILFLVSFTSRLSAYVQSDARLSDTGEGQVLFIPSSEDAFLELDFQITEPELSGLVIRLTHGPDNGRYRIFLDGKGVDELEDYPDWSPRGFRELYAEGIEVRDFYLGSYTLTPGTHTIRFELVGSSPLSLGSVLGVDSVRLRERWHKKRKSLRPAQQ